MKVELEAGTDAATLCLFGPAALPDGFDRMAGEQKVDVLLQMDKSGQVCWINTGSDGGYLLHIYVDEPMPEELAQYARDPRIVKGFPVTTGRLCFSGSEYVFRKDDAALRRFSHMGESATVRSGTYVATLYRMDYPETLLDERFRAEVGDMEARIHGLHGCLAAIAVVMVAIGLISLVASTVALSFGFWLTFVLPGVVAAVLLPVLIGFLPVYRRANRQYLLLERQLPSIVAEMVFARPI